VAPTKTTSLRIFDDMAPGSARRPGFGWRVAESSLRAREAPRPGRAGGENIYPREVEEFLLTIPEVSDAYVIGVPSERYGEEVVAWVKLRDGRVLSQEELTAACRGRIASYKIPRYWKLVDAFPMTITGKVQKFVMREIATAELAAV
jgi:non-ribosomal peptide synthetase component E (peptide arylation enzyme)